MTCLSGFPKVEQSIRDSIHDSAKDMGADEQQLELVDKYAPMLAIAHVKTFLKQEGLEEHTSAQRIRDIAVLMKASFLNKMSNMSPDEATKCKAEILQLDDIINNTLKKE